MEHSKYDTNALKILHDNEFYVMNKGGEYVSIKEEPKIYNAFTEAVEALILSKPKCYVEQIKIGGKNTNCFMCGYCKHNVSIIDWYCPHCGATLLGLKEKDQNV